MAPSFFPGITPGRQPRLMKADRQVRGQRSAATGIEKTRMASSAP